MPFEKGRSGNPAGRPRGVATNQSKLRDSIAAHVPEILSALATAAKGGDVQAARLLLDRALPTLRPIDSPAPLGLGDGPADLAGAATAVLAGLSAGSLTPDQAGAVAGVLSALVRVRENVELERRIAALESKQ